MNASYLDPRNTGPNSEPTVELNSFVPGESSGGKVPFPRAALTKDFASDKVATSILREPRVFSARTPNFNFSLGRVALFETASPLVKNILLLIYGSMDNFVSATGHPLEPYIFAFDENLDSEPTVRAIGSAVGIYVDDDPNFYAYELFLDKLVSCIVRLEPTRINDAKYADRPKIGDVIGMSRDDFRKEAARHGWGFTENLYQDRLNFFRYLSLTDEEKFSEDEGIPSVYDTSRRPGSEPQSSSLLRREYFSLGI